MVPAPDPKDPLTLLCERCGYAIDHLAAPACPECGLPTADSLPATRPGSPWQQAPSPAALVRTNALALRRPRPLFRAVRVERDLSLRLLATNNALACLPLILPAVHRVIDAWPDRRIAASFAELSGAPTAGAAIRAGAMWLLTASALTWAGLLVLTLVERVGLVFFGRRSAWRTDPTIAWAVCAHASVGWIVATALAVLGWRLGQSGVIRSLENITWLQPVAELVRWSPAAVGFFLGMLVFESLVYVGFREMRFANRPRPTVAPAAAASPADPA